MISIDTTSHSSTPNGRLARTRLLAPALVACSAALVLSACGGDKVSTTTTTTTESPSMRPTPLPVEPSFKQTPAGAAADVTVARCGTDAGRQTASGTITNSTKKARDYDIVISWLKNGDGMPYGSGMAVVRNVQPGKATDWSITTNVATKVDQCVKTVHAGVLK